MKKSGTSKAKPKGTKATGKPKKTAAMPAAKTAKARKTSAPKAKAPAARKAAAPKAKVKPAAKSKVTRKPLASKAKAKPVAKSKAGNGRVPASKASTSSKSDPYKLHTLKDAARKDDRSALSSLGYQVARALVNVPKPEIRDTLADGVEAAMKVARNKRVKDTLAKLAKQLRAPAK